VTCRQGGSTSPITVMRFVKRIRGPT